MSLLTLAPSVPIRIMGLFAGVFRSPTLCIQSEFQTLQLIKIFGVCVIMILGQSVRDTLPLRVAYIDLTHLQPTSGEKRINRLSRQIDHATGNMDISDIHSTPVVNVLAILKGMERNLASIKEV